MSFGCVWRALGEVGSGSFFGLTLTLTELFSMLQHGGLIMEERAAAICRACYWCDQLVPAISPVSCTCCWLHWHEAPAKVYRYTPDMLLRHIH